MQLIQRVWGIFVGVFDAAMSITLFVQRSMLLKWFWSDDVSCCRLDEKLFCTWKLNAFNSNWPNFRKIIQKMSKTHDKYLPRTTPSALQYFSFLKRCTEQTVIALPGWIGVNDWERCFFIGNFGGTSRFEYNGGDDLGLKNEREDKEKTIKWEHK